MSCQVRLRSVLALVLFCSFAAETIASPGEPDLLIVDLYLNGQPKGEAFILRQEDDFLLGEKIIRDWGIVHPWPAPYKFRGQRYFSLEAFAGASVNYDARMLTLRVSMPAALLPLHTVGLERRAATPRIEDTGAYLDYDLNWVRHDDSGNRTLYSVLRPVVFGKFGNVAANVSYRDYSRGNVFADAGSSAGLKVLELTYTRDDPTNMRTLRVGDIFTKASAGARAFRMAGVQLATNFNTRPTFIRYPLPSFYGETTVPSALDVYINGRLRRSEQVEAGRYVLEDIPAVNGAGQMQIVVRDALGRRQVFAEDIYLATELLREGLSEYSLNLGVLRKEYGLENFEYGALAGSASWRYGLRRNLTVEGHAAFADDLAILGGASQYLLKAGGTASAALALSHSDSGTGLSWQLGYRQQASVLSYNLDVSGSTRSYAAIGDFAPQPKLQVLASAGKNFYEYGSVGLSVIRQGFYELPARSIVSASHSKTFSNHLSLTTYLTAIRGETDDLTIGIRFSMPFGDQYSVGGALSGSRGSSRFEAEVRRSAPVGNGYGYHLGASASDSSFIDAGAVLHTGVGRHTLDVRSSSDRGSTWEVGTSGSIAHLAGMTRATRQVRDAFAVVNVGGLDGVRVYRENQEIGRTNANGQLFIPALRPYLANHIRVELADLPLNARVGETDARATPYYRSGVVVNFDIGLTTNVLLRAVRPDGSPLPEGSIARVKQTGESFPVGMDGKLYLQGIDRSSEIEIRWGAGSCDIDVPYPAGPEVITKLGDVVCQPREAR